MPTTERDERWLYLHPAMLLFSIAPLARRLLVPLLVGGAATVQNTQNFRWFVSAMSIYSVASLLSRFFTFRYALGSETIDIKQGLFVRRSRSLAVHRIDHIDTEQSLLARRLGVVRLDIQTEGGSASEAILPALSLEAAERIRAFVRSAKRQAGATDQEPYEAAAASVSAERDEAAEPQPLYAITPRDILLEGATTFGLGFLLSGGFLAQRYLRRLAPEGASSWAASFRHWLESVASESPIELLLLSAGILIAVLLLAWLVNLARAWLRFHGFRVVRQSGQLLITSGLLTRRQTSVSPGKAQAVRIHMTALRRWFGLFRMSVLAPGGSRGGEGGQRGRSRLKVLGPIGREGGGRDLGRSLEMLWKDVAWRRVDWLRVDPYHRRQQLVRHSLVWTALLLALLATTGLRTSLHDHPVAIAALGIAYVGCLVASAGLARLSLRRTRYAYDEGFIYLAGGLLSFDRWIVPRERVQGVVLEQSLFQRRRALASLAIDVNGLPRSAALTIPNIDLERASALRDRFSNPARRRAR